MKFDRAPRNIKTWRGEGKWEGAEVIEENKRRREEGKWTEIIQEYI